VILHDFDYQRPGTLREALAILEEYGARASPLAGGTDLVVEMSYRSILQLVKGAGTATAEFATAARVPAMRRPEVVVSLADLAELGGVSEGNGVLRLGALTTMAEFAAQSDIPPAVWALQDAAGIMGSPLIRNRATIGGNLVHARPAADTAVAIMALNGRLQLANARESRWVDIFSFFTGPGQNIRRPDELLVCVELPCSPDTGSAYLRQGTRRQLEIALVGAASWLRLDPSSRVVSDARIALGAVAPTPVLATEAANSLVGRDPTPEALSSAAALAREEAKPIDDFRGSALYRLELIEVLVRRSLGIALSRVQGEER
jgi:CO/xanthine dehydrogenase FAD-binding subunit